MTVNSALTDEELVKLAQMGDLSAFTLLYERYLPSVYRRVQFKIPEQEVEDVTQEIFIVTMRSLKSFRCESRFSTWLRTLVNRQIADFYRGRKPESLDLETTVHHQPASDDVALKSEHRSELRTLRKAIGDLPENYREVLLLRFADELPFIEISEQTGQSLEATKSLFRRAVAALRAKMDLVNE